MSTCVFCEVVSGRCRTHRVLRRTENFVVFEDAKPQQATHLLVVPLAHIAQLPSYSRQALIEFLPLCNDVARHYSLTKYRVLINHGYHSQVDHACAHILSPQPWE